MTIRVLLLGRTPFDPQTIQSEIVVPDIDLLTGTDLDDVAAAFSQGSVDVVIMGAGLALNDRLAIIERVFESSESTSVHMKDRASGQQGMMPFVNAVLGGLSTRPTA